MFNDIISDSANTIMISRLNRAVSVLANNQYSTLEEYQVAIYSLVNKILSLQNTMQPLVKVKGETPAAVGDISSNLLILNEDAIDIASQMEAVEADVARLFNLAQAMQSSTRQILRQKLYRNTVNLYTESFINNDNIQSNTATLDTGAGVCLLPLIKETVLSPNISIGISSVGSSTNPLANLLGSDITTRYVWNGSRLELILNFTGLSIVNRLYIDLDNYDGLDIVELSSSPDGNFYGDILGSLNTDVISLDSESGKNSGNVIIDFPPQYCQNIKIVFADITGANQIALRGISLASRQYGSTGQVVSTLISNPVGNVTFSSDELVDTYTKVLHQISYDNIHFVVIAPGLVSLSKPFWYRAILSRTDSLFSNSPDLLDTQDPSSSSHYTLSSSSSVSLGSGITERVLNLTSVTGSVTLLEDIIPGSLQLQVGTNILTSSQYSFANNTITLVNTGVNLSVIYQTSTLGSNSLQSLKDYYSPQLKEIRFEN